MFKWLKERRYRRMQCGNAEVLIEYLICNAWQIEVDEKESGNVMRGRSVPNDVGDAMSFEVGFDENKLYSIMTLNLEVSPDRVAAVAELTCRMNSNLKKHDMIIGHYHFDIDTRQIRYCVRMTHEDFGFCAIEKADQLMMFPVMMLLLAKTAFAKVINGEASVVEAFQEYEGQDKSDDSDDAAKD